MNFDFARPEYFAYMVLVSIAVAIWYLAICGRYKHFLKKFGDYKLLIRGGQVYSASRIFLRGLVMILILSMLGLALVGVYRVKKKMEPKYEGMQVVFVIDGSLSMLAEDVKPSRFIRAKSEINEVARMLCAKGDRLGLVVVAEVGVPYIPVLTNECSTFISYVEDLDEVFLVENMPQGSNLSDGFNEGLKLFKKNDQSKVLIMVTDGEPADVEDPDMKYAQEKLAESATAYAQASNISLFLLGIGDTSRTSLVPKKDMDGKVIGHYVYEQGEKEGELLMTSPNPSFLRDIAEMFGGTYRHSLTGHELKVLMERIIEEHRPVMKYVEHEDRENVSKYFLMAALFLICLLPILKSP